MHIETLARIERSLRATTDGHLRWLQGSKGVVIPTVDSNNPVDTTALTTAGVGAGSGTPLSPAFSPQKSIASGGAGSLSLSMHTPRESPYVGGGADATMLSPSISSFVTPPRRPPLTSTTSSSLSPPSSSMAPPTSAYDHGNGPGEGAGIAGPTPSSGGLGLARASSGLRGLAGLMGRRYLSYHTTHPTSHTLKTHLSPLTAHHTTHPLPHDTPFRASPTLILDQQYQQYF